MTTDNEHMCKTKLIFVRVKKNSTTYKQEENKDYYNTLLMPLG